MPTIPDIVTRSYRLSDPERPEIRFYLFQDGRLRAVGVVG